MEDLSYRLNDTQRGQALTKPYATETLAPEFIPGLGASGFEQTSIFHMRVGLPISSDWSKTPSVSARLLRGQLLLEEVIETFKAMGLGLTLKIGEPGEAGEDLTDELELFHAEGSVYDPIEVADGLADIKVIANGTAVAFGIPQSMVDAEIWASNMSKVGEDGKPIMNGVTPGYRQLDMMDAEPGFRSDLPVGKVLKPDTYVPANIAKLYVEQTKKGI